MILDRIENSNLYKGICEKLEKGLRFLVQEDLASLAPGRYEIDGKDVYAMVQEYEAKPHEEGKWEAHRRYIDIQYIVHGEEIIGYTNIEHLKVLQPYDPEKDLIFLEGKGELVHIHNGYFMILFPEDAHMPGLKGEKDARVKKVVVKVLMD